MSPHVHDVASAAEYLRHEGTVTLSQIRHHYWGLIITERATDLTPDEVLRAARQELRPLIVSLPSRPR